MSESRPPGAPDPGGGEPDRTSVYPAAHPAAGQRQPADPDRAYQTDREDTAATEAEPGAQTGNAYPQDPTYAQQGWSGQGYPPQAYGSLDETRQQYGPQWGYAQPQGYGQPGGYASQEPYPPQQAYPQPQAYSQQQAYPQHQGYPQQRAYPQHQGYPQQQAYPPQQAYPRHQGYPYPQSPGYAYPQPYAYPPAGYGPHPALRPRRRVFGIVAALLTVIGGALLAVSFTAVDWVSQGSTRADFTRLRHVFSAGGAPGLPHAYFSWAGWALLGGVVAFGILGAFPTPAHVLFRLFGFLVGVAGIVLTYFAYYKATGLPFRHSLQGATVGFYMALAGFLVAAIGAATGPHRVRHTGH